MAKKQQGRGKERRTAGNNKEIQQNGEQRSKATGKST